MRSLTESHKKYIAGRQKYKCANNPDTKLFRLENYECPFWVRGGDGSFDNSGYEIDHIKEIVNGGSDEFKNLQALCLCCHKVKSKVFIFKKKSKRRKKERKERKVIGKYILQPFTEAQRRMLNKANKNYLSIAERFEDEKYPRGRFPMEEETIEYLEKKLSNDVIYIICEYIEHISYEEMLRMLDNDDSFYTDIIEKSYNNILSSYEILDLNKTIYKHFKKKYDKCDDYNEKFISIVTKAVQERFVISAYTIMCLLGEQTRYMDSAYGV